METTGLFIIHVNTIHKIQMVIKLNAISPFVVRRKVELAYFADSSTGLF